MDIPLLTPPSFVLRNPPKCKAICMSKSSQPCSNRVAAPPRSFAIHCRDFLYVCPKLRDLPKCKVNKPYATKANNGG